jgi:hypothetical protein
MEKSKVRVEQINMYPSWEDTNNLMLKLLVLLDLAILLLVWN